MNAEDQREAECEQRVDAADDQAVEKLLRKDQAASLIMPGGPA